MFVITVLSCECRGYVCTHFRLCVPTYLLGIYNAFSCGMFTRSYVELSNVSIRFVEQNNLFTFRRPFVELRQ